VAKKANTDSSANSSIDSNTESYDILAIGAHPDDVEVGCGGLIPKSIAQGYTAAVAIFTKGEMGTGGTVEVREKETADATRILGADLIEVFDFGDTQLIDTYEKRTQIAELVRRVKPTIVLCPYPQNTSGRAQCHPDHIATGQITINGVGLARLAKLDSGLPPHHVDRVFHYFLPTGMPPSFVVDITDYFDTWKKSLKAHASQFQNPDKEGDYMFYMETMARTYGQMGRCKYAQGYFSFEPLMINDIMDLAKVKDTVIKRHSINL
jgi:N-acetylglucosamine malate deacetylase 1